MGANASGGVVTEARLRIRHDGCWTMRVNGRAHVTQIAGDQLVGVNVVHAPTEEELKAILADMTASTERVDVVERTPGTMVVRCRCRADGVVGAIVAHGCTILWPAVYARGTELYTVVAPTRERMDNLVRRLREMGEVTLERVSEVPAHALDVSVSLADVTTGLTERQLAVLRRAVEQGYYDSPRRVSADALAVSFGVSRSTFQEHLRKAEQRVLARFADVLAHHPVLLESATKRPGRPARDVTLPGAGRA